MPVGYGDREVRSESADRDYDGDYSRKAERADEARDYARKIAREDDMGVGIDMDEPQSAMASALFQVDKTIASLGESVRLLERKLDPVLIRESEAKPKDDTDVRAESDSEHVIHINVQTRQMWELHAQLRSIASRLQV